MFLRVSGRALGVGICVDFGFGWAVGDDDLPAFVVFGWGWYNIILSDVAGVCGLNACSFGV